MANQELEGFRLGLLAVFRNMDDQGLSVAERDRLRMAFDHARKGDSDIDAPRLSPELEEFHERIMGVLVAADLEPSPEGVADLEALVREHLPSV
jgi:hypothetical protein